MLSKKYWEDRAKKHGHTGYADPFLYAFDQQARIYAIKNILSENNISNKKQALDFGCGSGDFIALLLNCAEKVTGYDTSETVAGIAAQRYSNNEHVNICTELNKLKEIAGIDIFLSVTVLQSLSKTELQQYISILSVAMSKGAVMICMEFFSTDPDNESGLALEDEWKGIYGQNGFLAEKVYHFYNPVIDPVRSWIRYKTNPILHILKPLKNLKFIQNIYKRYAWRLISGEKDVLSPAGDTFKIYFLRKE